MRRLQGGAGFLAAVMAAALFVTAPLEAAEEGTAGKTAAQKEAGGHETGHQGGGSHGGNSHGENSHGGGPKGVPLDFQRDLALWSLVVFLVFVFVLWKFAWGPLSQALDQRESRIAEDLTQAEQARLKAEQMLVEHQQKLDAVQDEVREIIAEARRDAEHTRQEIIETAQREAEASRQRAVADIERARDAALKELFDTLASQVTQATEYVIGRSLTEDDQKRLVEEALREISRQN